jgi:hypothetical protein
VSSVTASTQDAAGTGGGTDSSPYQPGSPGDLVVTRIEAATVSVTENPHLSLAERAVRLETLHSELRSALAVLNES